MSLGFKRYCYIKEFCVAKTFKGTNNFMLINVVYSSGHLTNQVSVLLIMTSCENNLLNSKCTSEWVKTIFMFSTP